VVVDSLVEVVVLLWKLSDVMAMPTPSSPGGDSGDDGGCGDLRFTSANSREG